MNRSLLYLAVIGSVVLGVSCSNSPAPVFPTLESRLSGPWRAGATTLKAGQYTIYYQGKATADLSAKAGYWRGIVQGDILVIDGGNAIIVPEGKVVISPSDALRVEGPSKITVMK